MTICISAFAGGKAIVSICDTMATMVGYGGKTVMYDAVMTKYGWIGAAWRSAFTGNDISHLSPVYAQMRDGINAKGRKPPHDFLDVSGISSRAYHNYWERRLNTTFFGRFNTTLQRYMAKPARFSDSEREEIFQAIRDFNVPLSILVWGWDNRGPHILTVDSPGVSNHYDTCGFWSVGATSGIALDYLSRCRMGGLTPEEAIVRTFEAKFKAEDPQRGVGPNSDATLMYWDAIDFDRERELFFAHEDIEIIKACCSTEAYETTGRTLEEATALVKSAIGNAITRRQFEEAILAIHLQD